jgi:hypothetical protein
MNALEQACAHANGLMITVHTISITRAGFILTSVDLILAENASIVFGAVAIIRKITQVLNAL